MHGSPPRLGQAEASLARMTGLRQAVLRHPYIVQYCNELTSTLLTRGNKTTARLRGRGQVGSIQACWRRLRSGLQTRVLRRQKRTCDQTRARTEP